MSESSDSYRPMRAKSAVISHPTSSVTTANSSSAGAPCATSVATRRRAASTCRSCDCLTASRASLPIRIAAASPAIANATSETRSALRWTRRLSYGGAKKNAPARTPSTTPASAGLVPPMAATAMTTRRVQNRNPPGPRPGRNGSKASVISAGPATARTHAAAPRDDCCFNHAQAGVPSTLTR